MIGGLGTTELIIILVIVLVIFGAGKLPEVGGALGKGIRNFRSASKGEDERDVTPDAAGTKRASLEDHGDSPSGSSKTSDSEAARKSV